MFDSCHGEFRGAGRAGLGGFLAHALEKGDQRGGDEIFLEESFAAFAIAGLADDFHWMFWVVTGIDFPIAPFP